MPALAAKLGLLTFLLADLAAVLSPGTALRHHAVARRVSAFLRVVRHVRHLATILGITCAASKVIAQMSSPVALPHAWVVFRDPPLEPIAHRLLALARIRKHLRTVDDADGGVE